MTKTVRRPLQALLDPKSIAIIGASDDPARIGGRPIKYMLEAGFAGPIYPINPKRETVQGLKCYPSIADTPTAPDCAIIAVPAPIVVETIEACAAKGVGAAVIFSSGFAEMGEEGAAMQARLTEISHETGIRLLGPNCLGTFNAHSGWFATFSSSLELGFPEPGPVAIVSQSGAYGSHAFAVARARGVHTSYVVTTGNECDVEVSECIAYMAELPGVKVIIAYAEGVRDGEGLRDALAIARRNKKPVIFMKVGRTEIGAKAAASHTASLAGSDAIYDALFKQYGVYRVGSTDEMLDVAYACQQGLFPDGNSIGLVTISGGVGVQMADKAVELGLEVPEMPEATQKKLLEMLPFAAVRNPVDITAQAFNDTSLISKNMEIMLNEGGCDAVVGFFTMVAASKYIAEDLIAGMKQTRAAFPDRPILLSLMGGEEILTRYQDEGYPVFEDPTRMVAAAAALLGFGRSFGRGEPDAPPALPSGALAVPSEAVGEHRAKEILASAGIRVARESLAGSADEAVAVWHQIGGPVVLKIASPDITHKTEIGGVLLGLDDKAAVDDGYRLLIERAAAARPDAKIDGVIVAEMVSGGIECVVGVTNDPVFGPAVVFGLGGVLVEVLKDVTFRLAPFGVDEARRMIREIKGYAILEGVRGQPPGDVDALAETLAQLSVFAAENADHIASVDINPLLVLPNGVVAVDGLIVPTGE